MKKLTISIVGYMDYDDLANAVYGIEKYTPYDIKKAVYIVDNGAAYDPKLKYKKGRYTAEGRYVKRERPACHEELKSLEECFDDVVCIASDTNAGFGAGHNMAIATSESMYHAIVNPDIVFDSDVFTPMIEYMDAHPDIAALSPKLLGTDGEILHVYRRMPTFFDCFIRRFVPGGFKKRNAYHTMQDQDYTKVFDVEFAQGSFLLIRTGLLKEVGGFDERYFMYMEDADLCRRLLKKGRIQYFPYASVVHKWERGSRKSVKLFLTHTSSLFKYFTKWGFKWI